MYHHATTKGRRPTTSPGADEDLDDSLSALSDASLFNNLDIHNLV